MGRSGSRHIGGGSARHEHPSKEAAFTEYGYEITGIDVWATYSSTMAAAVKKGNVAQVLERVEQIVAGEGPGGFVAKILNAELGQ